MAKEQKTKLATGRMKGLNKYQRSALREGEKRVGREQIEELLEMSRSTDPADRLTAASYLCPCHVRRRIDEVWSALYRMLEDDDLKVRRAAWHTLEDGGKPDDPALNEIIERTLERDTDRQVLNFARQFSKGREARKRVEFAVAAISDYAERGKCDFCGGGNKPVKKDFETELSGEGQRRFAMVCEPCDVNLMN
jgi:hypothetical protein